MTQVRKIRLVRKAGNMYIIGRHPLGTKFWFDVYDWGLDNQDLSMHLFISEKERNYFRRKPRKKVPLMSGRISWKRQPRNADG